MEIKLGEIYQDAVTGFTGICTGKAKYLTGCKQALIAPGCKDIREMPESQWIDEQRLEPVIGQTAGFVLDIASESDSDGWDKPAPKR